MSYIQTHITNVLTAVTHIAGIAGDTNRYQLVVMGLFRATLSVMIHKHKSYLPLADQFLSKWKKPAKHLKVERMFKVEVRNE